MIIPAPKNPRIKPGMRSWRSSMWESGNVLGVAEVRDMGDKARRV